MAFLGIAPTGTVLPFAGSVAPDGWALCDGSAINRNTYGSLFSVISTVYGTGDGVNTFNLPDMRGVFPRGSGTNGTSNYGGVTGHTPAGGSTGNKGGQKTATNGLSIGASTAAAQTGTAGGQSLGTSNISLAGGSTDTSGAHQHTITSGNSVGIGTFTYERNATGNNAGAKPTTNAGEGSHSHGVSGSTNIAHSHSATSVSLSPSSVTLGAVTGDTETVPASLSLNYIIKL